MKKMNYFDMFLFSIIMYAMAIFFYTLIPNFLPLTKIIGLINILSLIIIYFRAIKKKDLIILFFIFTIDIFAIVNSNNFSKSFEHLAGITSTLLIINKICDKSFRKKMYESFLKNDKIIFNLMKIVSIIVLISLFNPKCYQVVLGDKVFVAFNDGAHAACSAVCLFLSLFSLSIARGNKKIFNYIYIIPFLIAILQTGARSYLIITVAILFILYETDIKKYKYRYILIFIAGIILLKFFISSNTFNKFIVTGNNQYVSSNKWEALTSGRLIWWRIDLNDFFENFNFLQKFIGVGYDYVYKLNLNKYGLEIWAHNDFIQLLLSVGIWGFTGYIIVLIRFFKVAYITFKSKSKFLSLLCTVLFSIIVLWQAVMNGFYVSQGYVFSVVLLFLGLENLFKNRKQMGVKSNG